MEVFNAPTGGDIQSNLEDLGKAFTRLVIRVLIRYFHKDFKRSCATGISALYWLISRCKRFRNRKDSGQ